MNYRQIETSREARLWITQVILPVLGIGAALVATVPEFREKAVTTFNDVTDKIKLKLHK